MTVIKTRLFWAGWGPDMANMRGWWLSVLWKPRPQDTPIGHRIKAALTFEAYRDGPDMFGRRRSDGVDSSRWTGLQYDWPPTFTLERGR